MWGGEEVADDEDESYAEQEGTTERSLSLHNWDAFGEESGVGVLPSGGVQYNESVTQLQHEYRGYSDSDTGGGTDDERPAFNTHWKEGDSDGELGNGHWDEGGRAPATSQWPRVLTHPSHPGHQFSDAFLASGQWGWWCIGRRMPGGCRGGHNDRSNDDTVSRFRCLTCKFDLCIECFLDASLMPKPLKKGERRATEVVIVEPRPRTPAKVSTRKRGPGNEYFLRIKMEADLRRGRLEAEEKARRASAAANRPKQRTKQQVDAGFERLTRVKPVSDKPGAVSSLLDDVQNCTFKPKLNVYAHTGPDFMTRNAHYSKKKADRGKELPPRGPQCTFQPVLAPRSVEMTKNQRPFMERVEADIRLLKLKREAEEKQIEAEAASKEGLLTRSSKADAAFLLRLTADELRRTKKQIMLELLREEELAEQAGLRTHAAVSAPGGAAASERVHRPFMERMERDMVFRKVQLFVLNP
jgi:hypothetical protein